MGHALVEKDESIEREREREKQLEKFEGNKKKKGSKTILSFPSRPQYSTITTTLVPGFGMPFLFLNYHFTLTMGLSIPLGTCAIFVN